jgi:two-component system sensor histidine kinase KdpD
MAVATRTELAESIAEEAERLDRLLGNLLNMTRLEAGAIHPRKEWYPLEEIVGAALARLEGRLRGRSVHVALAPDLPLVPLDGILIEQVLINLLENALCHTPPDTPIEVTAVAQEGQVMIEVADRGPGLPAGEAERIFEKFHRGGVDRGEGIGLGLTVCRGFVEAHGGRIWAENRPEGGPGSGSRCRSTGRPPPTPVDDE